MKKGLYLGGSLLLMLVPLFTHSNLTKADTSGIYDQTGEFGFVAGNGVNHPINPGPITPGDLVDPISPDNFKPRTQGSPLSIDFVSKIDFGTNQISNKDQTYFAKSQKYLDTELDTPNYIQVSDHRGNLKGWVVKVLEVEQFQQKTSEKYPILHGALLSLKNPTAASKNTDPGPKTTEVTELIPGEEAIVAVANVGEGSGTWTIRWGSQLTKAEKSPEEGSKSSEFFNSDVELFVPGKTGKEAGAYHTKLNWILSELPQNH